MPGPMGGGPRSNSGQKEKFDLKALKKILLYIKPYYPAIIFSIIFAALGSICTIIGPDKISDLMNIVQTAVLGGTDIDISAFVDVCIFLVVLYLVGAILSYLQQFIMATVAQRTSKSLRSDINKKINRLPLRYFDRTTKGDIISRVSNDVDTISQSLGSSIANLVSSITLFVGVIVMMFVSNWILALVTIGSSLLGFVMIALISSKSQKYFDRRQSYLGQLNGQIEEVYSNFKTVHSHNAEDNERERFNTHNKNIFVTEQRSQFLSGTFMPIMTFIGNLAYVLIFVVGVAIIVGGGSGVTLGTLVSFVIYAKLFSQPLSTFAQSISYFQQASAASKRVFEILDEKELDDESHKTARIEDVKGDIEFKNVRFGYDEDKVIIKNFSASVKACQKVAIVGPTGAGKTTIVNLLMRFYELDEGDITIDGVSIKDLTREQVHDLFDMILQDTWLFEGTIRENLVYNKAAVSDKLLDEVCEAVGLKHFISTLEHGYDTVISEDSALSEGQKQQFTIARAMIKDAPLLILDEATSNVDTRTELVIQEAMDKLTKNRTSFVIAHRLSTIKNADLILVLKDGDIIEQGNHAQLLEKGGFYAELYNSQFETIED